MLCVEFATGRYTVGCDERRMAGCEDSGESSGSITVEFLDYIRVRERMKTAGVGSFLNPAPPPPPTHTLPTFHAFLPFHCSKEPRT
jgi:hypothetical protein